MLAITLLLGGAGVAPGCATPTVARHGERLERAVEFERAATDGGRLWIVYRAETRAYDGRVLGTAQRAAVVALADLAADKHYPIDGFPLEHIAPAAVPRAGVVELALQLETDAEAVTMTDAPRLQVATEADAHTGFRLAGLAAAEGAQLRAAALDQRRLAPWTWPLFPLTLAADALALPPLSLLAAALFSWNQ